MSLKGIDGNVKNIKRAGKCVTCLKNAAEASGFCPECIASTLRFEVPSQSDFDGETHLLAPELSQIGEQLLNTYDDFEELVSRGPTIHYLWKEKGGTKDGKNTLAKIQRAKGELAFFAKSDFILTVSADHCFFFNRFQITALLFHELLHADYDAYEDRLGLKGHDFEGFRREVEIFGYWRPDIKAMAASFEQVRQPGLFAEAGR